eukprot:TRINITY_DN8670_c0_g1_i3.p1 TRINITY_DN8670_c0_g1~~TRINITY_DN8670_c0_g1_i3.p1  ORF type:complete len:407 (-),score=62.11 TRINITY_DN8670_c0_g1_i3:155-1375(-)
MSIANELRILRHINHPNLVHFYGAVGDADAGTLALVFEFLSGLRLDKFLSGRRGEGCSHSSSTRHGVLADVASATRYLHNLTPPVLHSDLKPTNAFVEELKHGFRTKLLDFGLSQVLRGSAKFRGGTSTWMAPELSSKRRFDDDFLLAPSADVYSFGCLGHFVLTGSRPRDVTERRRSESESTWRSVGDADTACERCLELCEKCAQAEPECRPSMNSVDASIRSCPHWRSCGRSNIRENDKLVSWDLAVEHVLRSAFASDKSSVSIRFDALSEDLFVAEATKAWSLLHGTRSPVGKPLTSVFSKDAMAHFVPWMQSRVNEFVNKSSRKLARKTYCFGDCRAVGPEGPFQATLAVTFSMASKRLDLESNTCVVELSLLGVKPIDTASDAAAALLELWSGQATRIGSL